MRTADELRRAGAKPGRVSKRRKDEAVTFELGEPPRPAGLPRAARNSWRSLAEELLGSRKLARTDGALLLETVQLRADLYRGAGERKEVARKRLAEIKALFDNRPAFAESAQETPAEPPALTLEAFLASVREERATFPARLRPSETVCNDLGAPYAWPDGDAASVAREYCLSVTQGAVVACELLKRACQRHLDDLERGAARGIFFDPVAARNIATWFGEFCGLVLQPWETWVVTSIFAWKQPSGLRRFREGWLSMGRKNGKSALAAGVGLFGLICDAEKFAEIYSAATKKEQARIIFRDACRYVSANAELKHRVKKFVSSLSDPETDGFFQPLSSDVRSMDGLRPSFILADEVHEWSDREQWDKLQSGVGSRTQPLTLAATTAGACREGFAYSKFQTAERLLTGVFEDDRVFVAIYQLDNESEYKDEAAWLKSNPNLGISVFADAIRKQLADVEQDPAALNSFLRYQCNLWVTFKVGRSIPSDKWAACAGPAEMPQNSVAAREWFIKEYGELDCWGGLDYGARDDMTAYVLLFRMGDNRALLPFFWMPEVGVLEKEKSWGVPLTQWAREGWLKLTPGDIVDPAIVKADILQICANGPGRVRSIGYDPWQLPVLMGKLAEEYGNAEIVAVPQKPSALTVPATEFRLAVFQGRLWHLNNPVLRWMSGNVVLKEHERHGGVVAEKLSPKEKIDGIQATITAWHRFLSEPAISRWDGNLRILEGRP